MDAIAAVVLIGMLAFSAWSWWRAPAAAMADQFAGIWGVTPWGKQLMLDFFGLEIVLALWMLADAQRADGSLTAAILCVVAMPVFGAMAAALYWLVR
ncbi:MAG: hypothetical protein AB1689_09905 [Thermodesulfobacteriota bacterium]